MKVSYYKNFQKYCKSRGVSESINEKDLTDQIMIQLFYHNKQNNYFKYKKQNVVPQHFIRYIKNRFPDSYSEKETWYMIKHNISEKPKCPICGKPVKINFGHFKKSEFTTYCSIKCMANSEETKNKKQETCLKKYGVNYALQSDEIKQRTKNTCLEKYGVEHIAQSEVFKAKYEQTSLEKYGVKHPFQAKEVKQKIQKTMFDHYGVNSALQSDEIKEKIKKTNLEKYGVENPFAAPHVLKSFTERKDEIQEKRDASKRARHTFETSSQENIMFELLSNAFTNVERWHKDSKYPFKCDFYIPEVDLYIEFQGSWTHGKHAFNETNYDDILLLNKWKQKSMETNAKGKTKDYYKVAIQTWTVRDPLKRQIARENNLNYLEFWNIDEVKDWLNKEI